MSHVEVSFTLSKLFSANRMFTRQLTRKGKLRLTPDYRAWRDAESWNLKQQTVGVLPIECRFDMRVFLPPTRMDHDNIMKPALDLCQYIGLISNDRNLHGVEVIPSDRSDCLVVLTLRPDLPGRPATKRARTWSSVATKRRPTPGDVARARRAGLIV